MRFLETAGISPFIKVKQEKITSRLKLVVMVPSDGRNNMNSLMWWGYLHANNTVQVKRWFGDHEDYQGDCRNNPFVQRVVKPFEANTQEEAIKIITEQLQLPSCSTIIQNRI